jgi:Mg-chelatase subunit ChlD
MNIASVAPIATATVIPLKPDYSIANEPVATSTTATSNSAAPLTEYQIQMLMKQGFTKGLSMTLEDVKNVFALRIWIVDNSGSMQKPDGHRIVASPNDPNSIRLVDSSRWDEIVECVEYHARLAGLIEAPTRFRLLNNPGIHVGPQQFSIADNSTGLNIAQQVNQACSIMRRARPSGCTPLTSHILEIHNEVSKMASSLRQQGQKVAIIIATDGLPTNEHGISGAFQNQEFVDALRMLEGLPVWVVIRLCTDDDQVVDFYNDLDGQLELSLEVLDDFCGEAAEVTQENPWLNYALPLHRLREFGYHDRVFDMLDERPLLKSEIRDLALLLFGKEHLDGMPDPSIDWDNFFQDVVRLLKSETYQYNPMTKRVSPWINTARLNNIHGSDSCGCTIM